MLTTNLHVISEFEYKKEKKMTKKKLQDIKKKKNLMV